MPEPFKLKEPIWEQQAGESQQAYRAARAFFELGVRRTLVAVAGKVRGPKNGEKGTAGHRTGPDGVLKGPAKSGRLGKWSRDYRWRDRATAYDAHLQAAKDRATVRAVESQEARRVRLRAENDENGLVVADQLTMKALEMLQWPLAVETTTSVTTDPAGRSTTVVKTVEPARWTMTSATEMLKTAKLIRDAALGVTAAPANAPTDPPAVDPGQAPLHTVVFRMTASTEPSAAGG